MLFQNCASIPVICVPFSFGLCICYVCMGVRWVSLPHACMSGATFLGPRVKLPCTLYSATLVSVSQSSFREVTPYESVPHPSRLQVTAATSDNGVTGCDLVIPRQGRYSLVTWQRRTLDIECGLFRDIKEGHIGQKAAYVRFMHVSPNSKKVHLRCVDFTCSQNHLVSMCRS